MNTVARRKLEDWIVAECYRMASGAPAPAGWTQPRGRRDGEWYYLEHPDAQDFPGRGSGSLSLSEMLLNYFHLEPSGPYYPGSPSNECFPDTDDFRSAADECRKAIARLLAEGVLVLVPDGGYRLVAPWVDLMAACEGGSTAGRAGADHCGRCLERV